MTAVQNGKKGRKMKKKTGNDEFERLTEIFERAIEDINNDVTNFCVNGECIGCGECCSNILPLTNVEIERIRKLVKNRNLKPIKHIYPGGFALAKPMVDTLCPFLDPNGGDRKCTIYKDRPYICKSFKCDQQGKDSKFDPMFLKDEYNAVVMRHTFWDSEGNIL